nr:hypothetical protein Iba_chr09aCG16450 [Ipomoea batatas]GMD34566.1 hypothetical protein Iba_chr09cCG13300 [Ipomoea batatas]GMD36309.1 hypothetical protein Iba_chr09dCG15190 [Ipomoea batatas]GME13252.1 hypothetical protein Iba_scaffold14370CG0760 [Ipomoea batatas]
MGTKFLVFLNQVGSLFTSQESSHKDTYHCRFTGPGVSNIGFSSVLLFHIFRFSWVITLFPFMREYGYLFIAMVKSSW